MNFLKLFKIVGGGEVPQSDEYPWGTDAVSMPIPLKFAQSLRENNFNNPLADQYKKFLGYKVFRLIPFYINHSNDDVLGHILKDIAQEQNAVVNPEKLYFIKLTKGEIKIFFLYRKMLNLYKESDDENDKSSILISIQTSFSKIFPVLKTNPLLWIDVLDTIEEIDQMILIREYLSKNEECVFIEGNLAFTKLTNDNSDNRVSIDDFDVGNNKNKIKSLNSLKNSIIIVKIAIHSITAGHATNMVIDNDKKRIYFSDSNGFDKCNGGLAFIKLSDKFDNYNRQLIMSSEFCPRGMFQGVSENQFCQTWSLFDSLLVVLNRNKLRNINDVNEIFTEVLDITKPVCYYKNSLSDIRRLSLILLEFMFYIYILRKKEFLDFLSDKNEYNKLTYELKKKTITLYMLDELESLNKDITDLSDDEYDKMSKIVKDKVETEIGKNKHDWEVIFQTYTYHEDVDSYISNEITDIKFDSENKTVYEYISLIVDGK